MKIESIRELRGFRGINVLRILVLVAALVTISGFVAAGVTNKQMKVVEDVLPAAPATEQSARTIDLDVLLAEAMVQQSMVETDASMATVALLSSRDLIRCDQAPSIINQGRFQIVGESLVTSMGLSASPLLGFVGLNAIQRYQCGWEGGTEGVPWFMADATFFTLAGLVLMIVFKDVLLSWFPPAKAALDGLEQVLQLAVAPVALGTVSSMFTAETGVIFAQGTVAVASFFQMQTGGEVMMAGLPFPTLGDAGDVGATMFLGNFIAAMIGVVVSFVLFVAGSLVAGLVMLAPLPLLDTLLRSVRGGAMIGMAGTSVAAPELSLLVAIPVFILALIIFPFALRLLVFGAVNALDFLPLNRGRGMGKTRFVRAFSGKAIPGLPKRTAGRLKREDDGTLTFTYAPLYIMPRKAMAIDEDMPMTVVEGVLMPSLRLGFRGTGPAAFLLPARYRKHGATIAERLTMAFAVKGFDGTMADGNLRGGPPARATG